MFFWAYNKDRFHNFSILQSIDENLETYLAGLLGRLNDDGKEMVLRASFLVAQADGHLDTKEIDLLHQIANNLEMEPTIIPELLKEAHATA